jgi:predicted deacetylase
MTMIVFRMDDITPDMNWEAFYNYIDLFSAFKVYPLLGIVPENKDTNLSYSKSPRDFFGEMRSLVASGYPIAQHGYNHVYITDDGGLLGINNKSEFAGLPYEEQQEKIQKGQDILVRHQLSTDIWMSPAHSYDRITLEVLKDLGFHYVSDGYSIFPYDYQGLRFIPCQMALPRRLPFGLYTICIHSNTSNRQIFERIHSFIKNNRNIVYDYHKALKYPSISFGSRWLEKAILKLSGKNK